MRYCRFLMDGQPMYGLVEQRDGVDVMVAAAATYDALRSSTASFAPVKLSEVALLPSVDLSKIICVGRNYRDHATELGNDIPKQPLLFFKPPSSLLQHEGTVWKPEMTKRLDFEGELGVVIGKRASRIGADEDVRQYIRGYTIVNDVTMRDIQKSDDNWTRGKGFDTSCPAGPVVTDEVDAVAESLALETRLNGEVRQHGETKDFIFPIPELLRYITAVMTLEPGDLIPTGTPAGVGPMNSGDVVEISIDGIGTLRNTVG